MSELKKSENKASKVASHNCCCWKKTKIKSSSGETTRQEFHERYKEERQVRKEEPSLLRSFSILRFLKLNLEFRKLRSFMKRRSCDEKKCLNFFYFRMVMTHFGLRGVFMIILFFLTCTGGTGKWKQFDSVGKFFLLYFLRFISLAVQHSPGTRLKTVHRWRVCRKILLRCELIILQNGHHCSVHRRKVCRNLLQLMNLSCELIE